MVHTQIRRAGRGAADRHQASSTWCFAPYLGEKAYIGVLFILGGLASLAVAARLWTRRSRSHRALGDLWAAGMAVGFILSRSIELLRVCTRPIGRGGRHLRAARGKVIRRVRRSRPYHRRPEQGNRAMA